MQGRSNTRDPIVPVRRQFKGYGEFGSMRLRQKAEARVGAYHPVRRGDEWDFALRAQNGWELPGSPDICTQSEFDEIAPECAPEHVAALSALVRRCYDWLTLSNDAYAARHGASGDEGLRQLVTAIMAEMGSDDE